jgi:putative ATP-binding cassette transporter
VVRLLLARSRKLVAASVAAGLANGLAGSALLALANQGLSRGAAAPAWLLWGFFGLAALVPVTQVLAERSLARLGQDAGLDLTLELARRILDAPLARSEEMGPARLLAHLADDVAAVMIAYALAPAALMQAALLLGSLVYLGWLSGAAALLVGAGAALGAAGPLAAGAWARRHLAAARERQDALFQGFRGLTEGAKELKLHRGRRLAFTSDLRRTADAWRRDQLAGARVYALSSAWPLLVLLALLGILVFHPPGEPAAAAGYALVLLFMTAPLNVLAGVLPALGQAGVALDKVRASGLALAAETGAGPAAPGGDDPGFERLELAGVTYAHAGDGFVLGPVDLSFRRGELVFLSGGNGSGKTTLAKLLTGLYEPTAGEVRVDGAPVTDAGREAYRQRFSAVFWDFHLFDALLGLDRPALDEEARGHLARLGLGRKLEVAGGRFSTLDLSAGQRKRLALATVWLEDRPVCLFDEWAADQDPGWKEVFYRELLPELKARGRTLFVISHDDRFYGVADRLIRLEGGRVASDSGARA